MYGVFQANRKVVFQEFKEFFSLGLRTIKRKSIMLTKNLEKRCKNVRRFCRVLPKFKRFLHYFKIQGFKLLAIQGVSRNSRSDGNPDSHNIVNCCNIHHICFHNKTVISDSHSIHVDHIFVLN